MAIITCGFIYSASVLDTGFVPFDETVWQKEVSNWREMKAILLYCAVSTPVAFSKVGGV